MGEPAPSVRVRAAVPAGLLSLVCMLPVWGGPPGEVAGLGFASPSTLSWSGVLDSEDYNVYRGSFNDLAQRRPPRCFADEIATTSYELRDEAQPDQGFFYLVTAESADGEATAGSDSDGGQRELLGSCDASTRHAALNRLGYGWSPWNSQRLEVLGLQGYVNEQLDPEGIDESDNTELQARRQGLIPPASRNQIQALHVVNAVHSRRQLEQKMTLFWTNHFNTEFLKTRLFFWDIYRSNVNPTELVADLHYDEVEAFRHLAFYGNFRQMLEASALSPAMIIYLDTTENFVGEPNENYARELMELHTMGVDGGYTEQDVAELARVLTGWTVCKKLPQNADDLLAPCIDGELLDTPDEPDGSWVAHFRPDQHDCGQKTLFGDTPHEELIGETCSDPDAGVNELFQALDAICAHEATARFIAGKLVKKLIGENPGSDLVDAVVAVWNDPTHPHGIGDLREVLRVIIAAPTFAAQAHVETKIKTPFEHVTSGIRAVRGTTDGYDYVSNALQLMSQQLHDNPEPTGYPDRGSSWIDTTGTLQRQSFGANLVASGRSEFADGIQRLLAEQGVSSAPGQPELLVDFFSEALFGGALASTQRQLAIDFLLTDDDGAFDPDYDMRRIRQTVGFMLGLPRFQTH